MIFVSLQISSARQNSRTLVSLRGLTRIQAFESRFRHVRNPGKYNVIMNGLAKPQSNILALKEIPPMSTLEAWKKELCERKPLPNSNSVCFVESPFGRFYENGIDGTLQILNLLDTKRAVEKELDWFSTTCPRPHSVASHPSAESIQKFKSMLYGKPLDKLITGLQMSPDEIAKLCCDRWISTDQVQWICDKLNALQSTVFCIPINHVQDITLLVQHSQSSQDKPKPTSLFFFINVGKDTTGKVFIANHSKPGNHWTMCHVDAEAKRITYGDSLGWRVPFKLRDILRQFVEAFFEDVSGYSSSSCHAAGDVNAFTNHKCGSSCASQYPLQTCTNVCGVVVLLMAVYACMANSFFAYLTTPGQCDSMPNLFISTLSQYSKYLQRVLMVWIGEGNIHPEHMVPSNFLRPYSKVDEHSDSDSDIDTPRVPLGDRRVEDEQEKVEDGIKVKDPEKCPDQKSRDRNEKQDKNEPVAGIHQCPECHYASPKVSNIKRHMQRKHGILWLNLMLYQPVLYILPKLLNKLTFPKKVDQGFCGLFTESTGVR